MTHKELEALTKGMAGPIVKLVKDAIDPIKADLAEARAEIAVLKSTPYVKFCGIWDADVSYTVGDAVTRSGALWICKAPPIDAPGVDFLNWQLAVKKGAA